MMWPTPRETMWHGGDILALINKTPSAERRTPQAAASISSVGASHARTSALQERALESQRERAAAYGQSTPELLANYDPATSSWRTSQLCLDGELSEFSETWPRSGMMRSGTAYQLPPLVRLTDETGSGLWPTPTADRWDGLQSHGVNVITGSLNPTFVEFLMGFPRDYTEL